MKIRSATFFHEPRSGKESGKETVLPLSAMLERFVSTLYLIFLKNNLKFNAEKLSIPSFLCIFAKELRI